MVARNSINLILLTILSQIFTKTPPQQYANGGSEVESMLGWKLQNHVYKTLVADVEFECVFTSQPKYAGK